MVFMIKKSNYIIIQYLFLNFFQIKVLFYPATAFGGGDFYFITSEYEFSNYY